MTKGDDVDIDLVVDEDERTDPAIEPDPDEKTDPAIRSVLQASRSTVNSGQESIQPIWIRQPILALSGILLGLTLLGLLIGVVIGHIGGGQSTKAGYNQPRLREAVKEAVADQQKAAANRPQPRDVSYEDLVAGVIPPVIAVVKLQKYGGRRNYVEGSLDNLPSRISRLALGEDLRNIDLGEEGSRLIGEYSESRGSGDEFAIKDAERRLVRFAQSKVIGKGIVIELDANPQSYDFDNQRYTWALDGILWTDQERGTAWLGGKNHWVFAIDGKVTGWSYPKVNTRRTGSRSLKYFPYVWINLRLTEERARLDSQRVKSLRYLQALILPSGRSITGYPPGMLKEVTTVPVADVVAWRLCPESAASPEFFTVPKKLGADDCTGWVGKSHAHRLSVAAATSSAE